MPAQKHLSADQTTRRLDTFFEKIRAKNPDRPLQIRIQAHGKGLDYTYPVDSNRQPYHTASIGKLFTAALVMRMVERGKIRLEEPIAPYFSAAALDRLFFYRGVDYASQVTVEHLLGHTSGIADYFEDKTHTGRSFTRDIRERPDTRWTPAALLEFTRANQTAVGVPGRVFHYSDSGYILLGMLIEKVAGQTFHRCLAEEIFHPLGMTDSYLMFYDQQGMRPPLEKIWFEETEVSTYQSLSCDWAGGGVVSTTEDMLKFSRALRGGLLADSTLKRMETARHRFRAGIWYGLGMMEIRFGEFFFLLGGMPRLRGHIGILSTHLFYDPVYDAHIAMNFGSTRRMVESFQALIEIENVLGKMPS